MIMYAIKDRSFRVVTPDMALADGEVLAESIPTELLEPLPADVVHERITQWLDRVVQAKGYDSIVSCASYASSSDDTFRADAQAAIAWRDAVYRRGYEILADIPASGATTPDEVMALLPKPENYGWGPISD